MITKNLQKASIIALPLVLALLISGSVWFQAIHYYLGIKHPSWAVWVLLVAIVFWRLAFVGVSRTKWHVMDITVLMFMATIIMSLCFKGLGDAQQAAIYLSAFIGLPYVAGRLMCGREVKLLLNSIVVIVVLSLPLVTTALMSLPETDFYDDRVKTLFDAYYINNSIGDTVGMVVVLLIAGFVGPYEDIWRRFKVVGMSLLAASLWLLVFIAARGGLLAALVVGGALLLFGKWGSVQRRSGILLFIVLVIAASFQTLPEKRVGFFKEVLLIVATPPSVAPPSVAPPSVAPPSVAPPSVAPPSVAPPSVATCIYVKGMNSPVAHRLYYEDALRLFRNEPIWGVGAGNFGYDVACGRATAFATPHSTLLQAFSELGIVGGGLFLVNAILIFAGLIRIATSDNKTLPRDAAWFILPLWGVLFFCDQISGNYFTSYQFYAVTGVAGAVLAVGRMEKGG